MLVRHRRASRALRAARSLSCTAVAALLASCGPGEQLPVGTGTSTPTPQLASVVISPSQFSTTGGDSVQFQATPLDAEGQPFPAATLSWFATSGTIDQAGLFRAARAAGPATIIVTAGGTVSDTANGTITLTPARVAAVTIAPANPAMLVGQTLTLVATPRDSAGNALSGRTVSWASGAPGVAAVTQTGTVSAIASGSATITATSESVSGSTTVTVSPVPVDHVVVTPSSASLVVGQTQAFSASPRDAADQPLAGRSCSWSAGNPTVATVSGGGVATAVGPGTGSAIATCDGRAGSATVTVTAVPVASVTVTPNPAAVTVGATVQLSATTRDASGNVLTGRQVSWSTSNAAVAAVSNSGLVTGVAAGSASITATSEGRSGSTTVNVTGGGSSVSVDTVFYEGFESGTFSRWDDRGAPANHAIVTTAGNVYSGTRALEITYPPGSDGGWLSKFFMPGYDSLYVRYWLRLEPTWTGGTKLVSFYGARIDNQWSAAGKAGVCPNGTDFFVATLTADPSPQMRMRFYTQYVGMPSSGGQCYGSNGPSSAYTPDPFQLTAGVWHKIEFRVRLNTPGQADGSQSFWVDDVLHGAWSGITFRTSTVLMLNSVTISASSPGGTAQARHLYIDDFLVTRQRAP